MVMAEIKVTKSLSYILPMLGDSFYDFGAVNSVFVGDVDKPKLKNHIFILYKYDGSKYFAQFESKLRDHELYETYYDPTPNHVMFVFRVPDKWQYEYDLFKESSPGCFKGFSVKYKNHIMKFFPKDSFDVDKIKKILWSHESLYKELEEKLGVPVPRTGDNTSVPDMKIEIFDKTKLSKS